MKKSLKAVAILSLSATVLHLSNASAALVNALGIEWTPRSVSQVREEISQSQEGDYEVRYGDTLSTIAAALDMSAEDLARLNAIDNPDLIFPGTLIAWDGETTTLSLTDSQGNEQTYSLGELETAVSVDNKPGNPAGFVADGHLIAEVPSWKSVDLSDMAHLIEPSRDLDLGPDMLETIDQELASLVGDELAVVESSELSEEAVLEEVLVEPVPVQAPAILANPETEQPVEEVDPETELPSPEVPAEASQVAAEPVQDPETLESPAWLEEDLTEPLVPTLEEAPGLDSEPVQDPEPEPEPVQDPEPVQELEADLIPDPEPVVEEEIYISSGSSYGPGQERAAFDAIVAEKGVSAADAEMWAALIAKESGWNSQISNPTSSAYGLPQALPGNKMASHGADWATNPYTQLSWMYDYMLGRYGSIQGAYNHSQVNNWY